MKVLTGLELRSIINELEKKLVGGYLNKIYQPDSKSLLLGFRSKEGKSVVKVDSGIGVFVSSHDYKTSQIPPSFCMFLRKHLMNSSLTSIRQQGLERVVEFRLMTKAGEYSLICELFGNGNFILTDTNYIILNLAVNKSVKDRTLKKGEKYEYPPARFNILDLTLSALEEAVKKWEKHTLVQLLASGLSLGGTYAEEVCVRSKLDKNTICEKLTSAKIKLLFNDVQKLVEEIDSSQSGFLYLDGGKFKDCSPIKLKVYSDFEVKQVGSYNEAVDALFAEIENKKIRKEKSAVFEKNLASLLKRLEIQKMSLEKYKAAWRENQRIADEVYGNYQLISSVLEKIGGALKMGYSWDEVRSVLNQERSKGVREANLIINLFPKENKILVDIAGGMEIRLDKSIAENAAVYYNKAKASKAKIEGAEKILTKTEKEIEKLGSEREEVEAAIKKALPKPIEVIKKEWYEKFRWFLTSSGLLAIGGRDATQNDMIIKRYMEVGDLVFHTEMAGSPFFLLKEGREKASDSDKEEVSIATASFSRAWGSGQATSDVYWVKPEQVTKQASAGEYLGKGAFMIRGKKNFHKNTALQISMGVDKSGRITAGPKSAITKNTDIHVTIIRGAKKKSDIAKEIARHLGSKRHDDIMQALPAGTFNLSR